MLFYFNQINVLDKIDSLVKSTQLRLKVSRNQGCKHFPNDLSMKGKSSRWSKSVTLIKCSLRCSSLWKYER